MIIGDERFAAGLLNPFELEPGLAVELAAMGNGGVDRRELQKVVLASARAVNQQQHKPNRLQRLPLPIGLPRQMPKEVPVNSLSLFGLASNGPQLAGMAL